MADPVNGRGQYQRGTRFEHQALYYFRANGYYAQRTPGSRSPVDVVAVKQGQTLFIQCKTDGSLPPAPWNELYDLARRYGAIPVLAGRPAPAVVRYWRLEARKQPGRHSQPRAPFAIDEIAEGIVS